MSTILAIETSCDETAVAIVDDRQIFSDVVASQIEIHRAHGGVIPEVASRKHLETINFCLEKALQEAGVDWSRIDAVAATVAPGLVGALMVGVAAAKTLAIAREKPFIGVHHLEGHIYASRLAEPSLKPPFLCLLVSGGHTCLIHVKDSGRYEQMGTTRDDAAGEAFDKVARLLQLGYPGGPAIDRSAREGDGTAFRLPEGKVSLPSGGFHPYDSSFSGLKTAVARLTRTLAGEGRFPVADLAASFQETVARGLTKRTIACALDLGLETIAVGGGVAANTGLRSHLRAAAREHDLAVYFPPPKLCTDNAAMIARAAVDHFDRGRVSPLTLGVRSRLPLADVLQLYG